MKKQIVALLAGAIIVLTAGVVSANTIINNSTLGYYNGSIGTLLDNTSPNFPGANISTGDPTYNNINPAPNLSAAFSILGNWLTTPQSLNSYWSSSPVGIPSTWPINAENAIIDELAKS